MTEIDWLIDCWSCIAHDKGQGSHTCCEVAQCCNIWLDRKRPEFRNGDLGHKNARTRPSGHVTNDETWDLRFSRQWTCKLEVVSGMTSCSFVGVYRFVREEKDAPIFREGEGSRKFLRQSGNHIWTRTESNCECIMNRTARWQVLNWTHR